MVSEHAMSTSFYNKRRRRKKRLIKSKQVEWMWWWRKKKTSILLFTLPFHISRSCVSMNEKLDLLYALFVIKKKEEKVISSFILNVWSSTSLLACACVIISFFLLLSLSNALKNTGESVINSSLIYTCIYSFKTNITHAIVTRMTRTMRFLQLVLLLLCSLNTCIMFFCC